MYMLIAGHNHKVYAIFLFFLCLIGQSNWPQMGLKSMQVNYRGHYISFDMSLDMNREMFFKRSLEVNYLVFGFEVARVQNLRISLHFLKT